MTDDSTPTAVDHDTLARELAALCDECTTTSRCSHCQFIHDHAKQFVHLRD